MKIMLGGVRGTSPVVGRDFLRYGGDTTSLLVRGREGGTIVVDAGTGIGRVADVLRAPRTKTRSLLLLMTHYHLDHLMGLPSFSPLYSREWQVTFAAPVREGIRVGAAVERLLAKPFWPVQLDCLRAAIAFRNLAGRASSRPLDHQGLQIRWCPVHHPEGCTAFRIDESATGGSFVFATDIEWGQSSRVERETFLRLCREPKPADILFFDGQFTGEEYPRFKGWGHSTWNDAAQVAAASGVGRVEIIHHAPTRTDGQLMAMRSALRRVSAGAGFARAGAVYAL